MRRVALLVSLGGCVGVVLTLSKIHARYVADPPYSFTGSFRFSWALSYIAMLAITTYAVGLPDQPSRTRQAAGAAAVAVSVAALGISIPQLLLGDALLPRFVVFGTAVALVPWHVAVNAVARRGRSRARQRDRVLLVSTPAEHERLLADLEFEPEHEASLVATITPTEVAAAAGGNSSLYDLCMSSAATVVVLDRFAQAEDVVITQAARLHESGIRVRTLAGFYQDWLGKLPISELERASLFFDIGEVHRVVYTRLKRVGDVSLAVLGAAALAFVTPLVVLGNLAGNRGPLLYRQTRVGKGDKHFTILKFRTMTPDVGPPDPDIAPDITGTGRWTELDDPRVTPFGRFLRRTHVDELPQMINVLRGDLAIVGPRPEQPHYVRELSDKLAFYELRHLVRPGLTGWAQVKYGYAGDERDALEKLQYEFFYLQNQSLTFDLAIVIRTLRSVGGGTGGGR